ncbi:hypothetical protein VTK73DRAFT_1748 [Phialemonium thermophilum]|uniref:Acyltransferase 3 domain-containing protein n=1 Tax=Phialemonium thermophilum TaxID=223376 RepID=A0ABR3X7V2_9PEZI
MAPQHLNGLGILDNGQWKDVEKNDWSSVTTSTPSSISPVSESPSWKSPLSWRPASATARPAKHYLCRLRSLLWGRSASRHPPEKLRRTAYLDGLRGFAAFLVYCQHHELWAHSSDHGGESTNPIFELGFGYDGKYAFCALPGIRTFFTGGHFAVAIFFAISGYVLTAKPLALLHAGDLGRMSDNLASALFRRWLRLYIPLMVTTFVYMLMWHLFFDGGRTIYAAQPQSNLRDEIWNWYAEFKNFSFIFTRGGEPWFSYNFHTWSIPVEMKGSIIVYTAVLSFSRMRTNARLFCTLVLMWYFMYVADGWYGCVFLCGVLIGDLEHLSAQGRLPWPLHQLAPYCGTVFWWHAFAVGIYLGGVPSRTIDVLELRRNRGWYYLSYLKPQATFDYKWFYLFWAAMFTMAAVPRLPVLRRFFETRFCQYLGRVSYALYLVHGPVLWILGDRLYTAAGWHTAWHRARLVNWVDRWTWLLPHKGPLGLEPSFLALQVVLLPVTFGLAELVTRWVDDPAVRLAAWLYAKMLPRPGEEQGNEKLSLEARKQ